MNMITLYFSMCEGLRGLAFAQTFDKDWAVVGMSDKPLVTRIAKRCMAGDGR